MFVTSAYGQNVTNFVDPRIGSEGLGRVFIGPSCPYGMVKPGPDCGVGNNPGWAPMPAEVSGFSQLHVSGTGGGPKYGNILINIKGTRVEEDIRLGYYSCTYSSGVKTEITTAERASFYRFTGIASTTFDLQHFLGRSDVPKAREAQQYEDSHLEVVNDSVTTGYQTISGGWNNGGPYTVYFYSVTHKSGDELLQKVGISFVSIDQAQHNLYEDIPHWDFSRTYKECIQKWESLLSRVQLADDTPYEQKRMFYTALYHTMIMPVDRTKDDIWKDGRWVNGRCYDDYYAIWDTYRTSTPLITLLDPERATTIVESLLNIYRMTGYMPDARSGNSNGRTQGGSNAEIVVADALAKGLHIDYELALEAMLKDAEVAPADDEAEGRGGLEEYNTLGYIPYGVARGGNRTVEYSFCDWAIAQVAAYLRGNACPKNQADCTAYQRYDSIYQQYIKQSERWKNLWRKDYVHDGAQGFIMPKSRDGRWLDTVPFGHSKRQSRTFPYTPDISYEGPWYCAWWDCYFYEASSWEYSLSIPHMVPSLIDYCGGRDAFEHRLDTFFEHGYYNVANEPSFLTPMLYHWIGRPEKSDARVRQIIDANFNASPTGIPGNDDSGSMSSWLAFHMMGLYPNAGHDYYLIHTPFVPSATISLANGRTLTIRSIDSDRNHVTFNGAPLTDWRITHQQLLQGGELIIEHTAQPANVGDIPVVVPSKQDKPTRYLFTYKLHGQTRRFNVDITEAGDSLILSYGIQRNLRYWKGTYTMTPEARRHATSISYAQPLDNQHLTLPDDELFAIVSLDVLKQIKEKGACTLCNTPFKLIDSHNGRLHLIDSIEGAEIWVLDNPRLPLIMKMQNNPVEIDWEIKDPQPLG